MNVPSCFFLATTTTIIVFASLVYALVQITLKIGEEHQRTRNRNLRSMVLPGGKLLKVLDRNVAEYTGLRYGHIRGRFDAAELAIPGTPIAGQTRNITSCSQAQYSPFPSYPFPRQHNTEDCLFLNIWTPIEEIDESLKPVVVVMVGGNFISGGSGDYEFFDGSVMASLWNQVIVVPNYRVGLLGFLNLRSLNGSGDAGISDQLLVLQWVKRNIAGYGGASQQVTLLGHEAGATAVGHHQITPESAELFHRAILISGSPYRILPRDASSKIQDISRDLLCSSMYRRDVEGILECLKAKSAESLMANQRAPTLNGAVATFCPVFNDTLTPAFNHSANSALSEKRKEVLVGTTEGEGAPYTSALLDYFGVKDAKHLDVRTATLILSNFLRFHGIKGYENVVSRYMNVNSTSPVNALAKAIGDFVVHCPVDSFVKSFAGTGYDVFVYHFKYVPHYRWWPLWMSSPQMLDWLYVSGNVQHLKEKNITVTDLDLKLSTALASLLACFSATG